MKKKLFGVIAGVAALTFALSGCASGNGAIAMKYDDMIHADGSYDQSLFYRNDLKTECADPGAFYVSEEESPTYGGWYYMFATSMRRAARAFSTAGAAATSRIGRT